MSLIALIIAGKLPGSDEYVECSDAKDRKFFSAIRLCADRLRVSRRLRSCVWRAFPC